MAVTLIQQSRTVQGGAQVVDRDEGLMVVTPIQQSRTVKGGALVVPSKVTFIRRVVAAILAHVDGI